MPRPSSFRVGLGTPDYCACARASFSPNLPDLADSPSLAGVSGVLPLPRRTSHIVSFTIVLISSALSQADSELLPFCCHLRGRQRMLVSAFVGHCVLITSEANERKKRKNGQPLQPWLTSHVVSRIRSRVRYSHMRTPPWVSFPSDVNLVPTTHITA